MSDEDWTEWPDHLRAAIDETGQTYTAVAKRAGIARATLTRILNRRIRRPSFEIVVAVAYASGVSVGSILGEPTFTLTEAERQSLENMLATVRRLTGAAADEMEDKR
jgi:transcriptional regulator with XRE-family HTH domain